MFTRRDILRVATSAATAALAPPSFSGSVGTVRYPDSAVKTLDPSFAKYQLTLAGVEQVATGMRFCEGPVWIGDFGCLLWSDVPSNRIMRWDERTNAVSTFREPANYANGNTRDRQGRLITCEQDSRRVTRTEHDGTITVLIDRFRGRPLNSPNDVVVKSDGSVWFTDPPYGIDGDYEGHLAAQELPSDIYRLDPNSGRAAVVMGDVEPNGLCFSPDEKRMYLVDYKLPGIRVCDVTNDGQHLSNSRPFVTCADSALPDGFRCDIDGNLWCGWSGGEGLDGVMVFNPAGTAIGHVDLPERCANICFGGIKRNRLFMAASHSIYSLYVGTRGVAGG